MIRLAACTALVLSSLAACGGPAPAHAPETETETPAAATPSSAPSAEAGATPAAEAPKAESSSSSSSPAESLARDLIKSGGRRIGYSASKKRFVMPTDLRTEGGRGLALRFYDDDGAQREIQQVCQPGECEDRLDEIARDLIPKLAARLEKDGYEPISAAGWPSGRDELPVGSLGGTLHYQKGRLSLTLDGKKAAVPLRPAGGTGPRSDALEAVYPVPAAKLLGVVVEGAKELYVFKLP